MGSSVDVSFWVGSDQEWQGGGGGGHFLMCE